MATYVYERSGSNSAVSLSGFLSTPANKTDNKGRGKERKYERE